VSIHPHICTALYRVRLINLVETRSRAQVDAEADVFDPNDAQNIEVIDNSPNGAPAPTARPRITTRYLTKYERARVIGTRALQIRCAYPPLAHVALAAN
jgi:hypothetical protein